MDHCVPQRFRRLLVSHEVRTTSEMGWANLSNGSLLAQARQFFGVFVTVAKERNWTRYFFERIFRFVVAQKRGPFVAWRT